MSNLCSGQYAWMEGRGWTAENAKGAKGTKPVAKFWEEGSIEPLSIQRAQRMRCLFGLGEQDSRVGGEAGVLDREKRERSERREIAAGAGSSGKLLGQSELRR